jgi:hypothetical protein
MFTSNIDGTGLEKLLDDKSLSAEQRRRIIATSIALKFMALFANHVVFPSCAWSATPGPPCVALLQENFQCAPHRAETPATRGSAKAST